MRFIRALQQRSFFQMDNAFIIHIVSQNIDHDLQLGGLESELGSPEKFLFLTSLRVTKVKGQSKKTITESIIGYLKNIQIYSGKKNFLNEHGRGQ